MEGIETEGKGWLASALNAITKAVEGFIKIFRKYGIVSSLLCMLLFVCLWSLIVYPLRIDSLIENKLNSQWEKEIEHVEEEKAEGEEMRIRANELITPLMEDIVAKFNVDRSLLFELHNNTKNIHSIDFLFFSCTYEAIDINDYQIDYIGDNLQRQYVSNMFGGEMMTRLKHSDYLEYSNLCTYKRDKRLLVKLHKFGCENVMLIPIRNSKMQPVLILCIGNKEAIPYKDVFDYIKPYIAQIQQALINE